MTTARMVPEQAVALISPIAILLALGPLFPPLSPLTSYGSRKSLLT